MRDKPDKRPDLLVARMAQRRWGVVSLDELRRCGLTREGVRRRVRKGWLHPLHRGVYAVGHAGVPNGGRLVAAVIACGAQARVSHLPAAAWWEFLNWQRDWVPVVTVPSNSSRTHPGIVVHRTRHLGPEDVAVHRRIPITSPARTLIDLAGCLRSDQALRRAVRRAMADERVSAGQLAATLFRLGPRRGSGRIGKLLAAGDVPTRSGLEDVVLELILAAGLERPDINASLNLSGRVVIPDFRWPAQRLVIEADGAKWHGNLIARADDAERQRWMEAHGETVVRVDWGQAVTEGQATIARLIDAGAPKADGSSG